MYASFSPFYTRTIAYGKVLKNKSLFHYEHTNSRNQAVIRLTKRHK